MPIQRQSNMELMRIVCMFFVILGHAMHALNLYSIVPNVGYESYWRKMIEAICVVGVNGFVLISGWFGIKFKWKGLLNLYLTCAFYSGVLYLVHLGVTGSHINRWCIYRTILPFSFNPGWWFIPCYLWLYLFSPILNKAINTMNRREHLFSLLLLTIVNVYFGFYRQMNVNQTGYNLMNFIYMYFIGRYLAQYITIDKIKLRYYSLFSLIGGTIVLGLVYILNDTHWHIVSPVLECVMYYNHPLVIINSIALLLFFSTFNFNSRFVIFLSSSVLAAYLLTDNNLLIGKWWYSVIANMQNTPPCAVIRT